jgi:hypothetical protein
VLKAAQEFKADLIASARDTAKIEAKTTAPTPQKTADKAAGKAPAKQPPKSHQVKPKQVKPAHEELKAPIPKQEKPPQKKKSSGCGCVAVILAIVIALPPVSSWLIDALDEIIYGSGIDTLFNSNDSDSGIGSGTNYDTDYDSTYSESDLVPEMTNPVTIVSDENVEITISIGNSKVMGYGEYKYYVVPILVQNKTAQDFGGFMENATADNVAGDSTENELSMIYIKPYDDPNDPDSLGLDFPAHESTLGWLQISYYSSEEPLRNFAGTLIIYGSESYETIGRYSIVLPEL